MLKAIASLLVVLVSSTALSAETPLQQFLGMRNYKARSNPGSFSLVGDIYPDKNRVGMGRVFKLSECFDKSVTLDGPEALENSTDVLTYGTSAASLLLNIAKGNPANAAEDLAKVEAAFSANKVKFVSLKATDLVHVFLSTGVIEREGRKSSCAKAIFDDGNFFVSDAIGATTLSYEFLDENNRSLSAGLSSIAGLLFKVGLSRSQTAIGSATFTQPVFIGFSIVRWNGRKFELQ